MLTLYKIAWRVIRAGLYPYAKAKASGGSELWKDRLGDTANLRPADIWLHAASAGEARILGYLIEYILEEKPDLEVHVTVMTPAGRKVIEKSVGELISVSYFPLDSPSAMTCFLETVGPKIIVVAETEIWPNMILEADRRDIPIVLVNARMSNKAYKRYRFIKRSVKALLSRYDYFFFKTEQDAERFYDLGADTQKAVVAGDMKFDAPLIPRSSGRIQEIRTRLGCSEGDFIIAAGSTRPGEEEALAELHNALFRKHENMKLAVAPRHLDRLDEVTAMFRAHGIDTSRYSESGRNERVIIVDSMGILNDIYLASDLAFVGGTLADFGGHNLLEPVWAGTPALYGPYTANVRDAAEYIESHDYGAPVTGAEMLIDVVRAFYLGEKQFAVKTEADSKKSPTAAVVEYILDKLKDA